MRIHGGIGLHVGTVFRDANSHGCIRVPVEACRILFDKCGLGTTVIVQE
ncbi:L,D-transpeptidase family protein [Akkermansia muciniphila]|nr:L,D-transpeptidase family protein [Akkermansia muciniphila]